MVYKALYDPVPLALFVYRASQAVKFLRLKKNLFEKTYHKNLFPVSVENRMIWSAFLHGNLELSCVTTLHPPFF